MDTKLLIGSKFEAGTEAEEHVLNPKTGAKIIDLAGGLPRPDRCGGRCCGTGLLRLVPHYPCRTFRIPAQDCRRYRKTCG